MNIFQLLTYNIKEHNRIAFDAYVPDDNAQSFWRLLWRQIMRAFGRKSIKFVIEQVQHPFYKEVEPIHPIVFIPISRNNTRVLQPIWELLNEDQYSIIRGEIDNPYLPSRLVRFWSAIFMWPLLCLYIMSDKREKLLIRTYFDEFFYTIGYIKVLGKLMEFSNIKLIVLANDHCALPRSCVKLAHKYDCKVMYMQHCSVTRFFPPLLFDYSLLDGEESLLKYITAGKPMGAIYLTGNPRFDVIKRYNIQQKQHGVIGIAINSLDKEEGIKKVCLKFIESGYSNLVVRPHPEEPFDPIWYLERGIKYSDSNKENPFEFLSKMDLIISGECGIHLDAAQMGVRSVCYNFNGEPLIDWYSYVKNGLTPFAENIDVLMKIVGENMSDLSNNLNQKARWYNAAYGMPVEGHVGEMLADFIRYELAKDVEGFDKKYGFVEKEVNRVKCKVYKE